MPKILIADNTDFTNAMLCDILTQNGYTELFQVSQMEETSAKASALQPELIILNMDLKGMDSLDILRKIKTKTPHISVAMITEEGQEDRIIDAITAGANGFITRPFQSEKVLHAIRPFLEI